MNKVSILRDLEYIGGSMTTLKTLCDKENSKSQEHLYQLLDEWIDVVYNIIDQIDGEEETNDAAKPTRVS